MRTSDSNINPSLKKQITKTLAQTIADIKSAPEAEGFLKDFFTKAELETFAKRIAIAYWLKKGRSYANIKKNLKVSSATIATVQEQSTTSGFNLALQKIEADEWASQWADKIKKFVGR